MLFASAILLGIHPIVAILIAGPIGALVAIPVAMLIFRLRGAYFAIGTWVVAEVFRLLASQISVLGGRLRRQLPAAVVVVMAPSSQTREFEIYRLALALTIVVFITIVGLLRSRHGLALTAIRDNEMAAQSTGISVSRIKFLVYILTAFGTAMIGALIFLQKLPHFARYRIQRERLDRFCHFHHSYWRNWPHRRTDHRHHHLSAPPSVGRSWQPRSADDGCRRHHRYVVGAERDLGTYCERFGWQVMPLQRQLTLEKERTS